MAKERETLPRLFREQLRLGELPEAKRRALEAELGSEAVEAGQPALAESDEQLRRELPTSAQFALKVQQRRERQQRQRSKRPFWFTLVPATVAVAAALLVLRPTAPETGAVGSHEAQPGLESGTRVKGLAPGLHIYRKRGVEVEPLSPGDEAQEGDLIQLTYTAVKAKYGVIFSLDGRGVVTLHHPRSGAMAAPLEGEKEIPLSESYRLDDAPSFERFFFVTSDAPFAIREVQDAAGELGPPARTGALPLRAELSQSEFLILKGQL